MSAPIARPSRIAHSTAARFITGSTLLVDAGSHLAPMARDFAFVQPTATATTPTPLKPA